ARDRGVPAGGGPAARAAPGQRLRVAPPRRGARAVPRRRRGRVRGAGRSAGRAVRCRVHHDADRDRGGRGGGGSAAGRDPGRVLRRAEPVRGVLGARRDRRPHHARGGARGHPLHHEGRAGAGAGRPGDQRLSPLRAGAARVYAPADRLRPGGTVVLTGWQSEPVATRSVEQPRRRGVGLRRAACGAAALLSVVLALPSAGAAQSRQPPQPPAVAAPEGYFGVPGGGWLGVGVQTRFTGGPGALSEQVVITRVEPGSPAARAGLRRGDAVLEINGQPAVAAVFHALPFTLNAGDTVRLLVRRQDRDRRVVVVAGERPGRYALERVT